MRPRPGAVSLPRRAHVLQPTISPSMPSPVAVGSLRSPDDADRSARRHTWGEARTPERPRTRRFMPSLGAPGWHPRRASRWRDVPSTVGAWRGCTICTHVAPRCSPHASRQVSLNDPNPPCSLQHQMHGCRADRSRDQTYRRNRPCSASQASRAVSSMRTLRPIWTTGRRPVHRSRAKVSGLTPNHRWASARGISCGGAGSSRGRSCCRADGRMRGRRRLGEAAMARVAPRRSWTCDAVDRHAPQTGEAWADTGATALTIYANIIT
jgi:hypothetical protein